MQRERDRREERNAVGHDERRPEQGEQRRQREAEQDRPAAHQQSGAQEESQSGQFVLPPPAVRQRRALAYGSGEPACSDKQEEEKAANEQCRLEQGRRRHWPRDEGNREQHMTSLN